MGWTQPNRAPAGCLAPRCVHVEERVSTAGGVSVPMDRCVEGHPMHEGCGYHVTAEAVRLRNARDEALLVMARAPFVPRGAR